MDFKHIEAFVWVAEMGDFRLAAEKLHTTQPAISQRIAALESTLAVRLFDRGGRGIRLTEKGQELLSHARAVSWRCGTVAAIGGIRPVPAFEMELDDPVLDRKLRHQYTLEILPIFA